MHCTNLPRYRREPASAMSAGRIPDGLKGQATSITEGKRGLGQCFTTAIVVTGGAIVAMALLSAKGKDTISSSGDWQVLGAVSALQDSHPDVRQHAVKELVRLEVIQAIGEISKLLKDTDTGVRQVAVAALGRLGAKDQASAIIPLLKAQSANIRQAAAYA